MCLMPPPGAAKKDDEQKGGEGAPKKNKKRGNALDLTRGVRVQEVGRHELTLEVMWQIKRTKNPSALKQKVVKCCSLAIRQLFRVTMRWARAPAGSGPACRCLVSGG